VGHKNRSYPFPGLMSYRDSQLDFVCIFVLCYLSAFVTHAGCIAAVWVGRSVTSVCVFVLSVCPHSNRKVAWAISTIVGRHIVYGRTLACTDPEVKRSQKVKDQTLTLSMGLQWRWAGMQNNVSVHFDTTAHFLLVATCAVKTYIRSAWVCMSIRLHISVFALALVSSIPR